MTGCQTCGGFGNRHDPVAHGTSGEPETGHWEACTACRGAGGHAWDGPCSDCLGEGRIPLD